MQLWSRSRAALAGSALLVLALSIGCGAPTQAAGAPPVPSGLWSGCGRVSAVTGVSIARPHTTLGPSGGVPALSATTADRVVSRRLYGTACRLVQVGAHPMVVSCPAAYGVVYTIRFRSARPSPALATYAATGCHSLTMRTGLGSRSTLVIGRRAQHLDTAFRSSLAGVLKVPVNDLG